MRSRVFYLTIINVLILIVFFNCSSSENSATENKNETTIKDSVYDVFVVAGQSNTYWGQGYDSTKDKYAAGIYQVGRNENNLKIIDAKEPIAHFNPKPDRVGFSLTFAKLYQKSIENKHAILIIPCGMDNTGFDGEGWHKGDFLFDDAVKRINYVFKKYPKSKLIGILWHQGEKDIGYKNYQRDLDTFIVQFRKDIGGNSHTPFILGGMVPYWVDLNEARKKQQKIIKNTTLRLPDVGYVDPTNPTKIEKSDNNQDTMHYNAEGQRELGKRYFEVYKNLQLKNQDKN